MANLTPKQERFAQLYVELGNASEAYRQAYDTSAKAESVHVRACELMRKPDIKKKVELMRSLKMQHFAKSNSVPVSKNVYDLIVDYFSGIDEAKEWASAVLTKAAHDLGADVALPSRGNINKASRYSVLERAGFKCQACGEKPSATNDVVLNIDHIIPHSLGGSNDADNLQVLCRDCNLSKGNRYAVSHHE